MWKDADPEWRPAWAVSTQSAVNNQDSRQSLYPQASLPALQLLPQYTQLARIRGLGWRKGREIQINMDRPFIKNLDDLPIPYHHLLPINRYQVPLIKGPYTFIVTSRGCPAGCKFCIKHVSYQYSVRLRSPELLVEEMWLLKKLGVRHIQMYADLFTVNRDQVMNLSKLMVKEGLKMTWTCNSRVDYVDEEMLSWMGRAGCQLISWGIESGNESVLKNAHKGYKMQQAFTALQWAHKAGIKNWGYFIIGLPGETVESIKQTIALSKKLPIDIALFHVAAPYPGTPFFFEAVEKGWFRQGVNWEAVDMDQTTVLDYPGLRCRRPFILAKTCLPRMGSSTGSPAFLFAEYEYLGRL